MKAGETGPVGYLKFPLNAWGLNRAALGLLLDLLLHGEEITGRLETTGHGLTKEGTLVAAAELRRRGFLGEQVWRYPDGTTRRVPYVTAIPGELPEGFQPPAGVTVETHLLTRGNAGRTPRAARTYAGETKSHPSPLGPTSKNTTSPHVAPRDTPRPLVPPGKTPKSAGRTKGRGLGLGPTSGNTPEASPRSTFPQVAPRDEGWNLVPPAETGPVEGAEDRFPQVAPRDEGWNLEEDAFPQVNWGPSRARASSPVVEDLPLPPHAVPGARGHDQAEEDALLDSHHTARAFSIMETLQRYPASRHHKRANDLCRAIAQRLALGRTEDELRKVMDAPYDKPVGTRIPFLLARVESIPKAPVRQGRVRDSDSSFGEVRDKLAQDDAPLYTRQGERPGAVDTSKVEGGWRTLAARLQAGEDDV